jgi:protocatechuate 3,4-dioxygenase beta subunit
VSLRTIKPGAHPVPVEREAPGERVAQRAPHLRLTIFASGIDRLVTQIFFDDEPLNASDPVLAAIPDTLVRDRLIAARGRRSHEYTIDIVLRGDAETPFFDDWSRPSFEPDQDVAPRPGGEGRDWD